MYEFSRTAWFLVGLDFGVVISAVIAGLAWISKTKGFDHPLGEEEIKTHLGESWGE